MKKFQSKYPLGQALIAIFESSGLNLPQFLQAIGYRNINKGLRSFHALMNDGVVHTAFMERLLASPYQPQEEALRLVCQQHVEQINQEILSKRAIEDEQQQREFSPFVHAIPALSGSCSITLFAMTGGFKPYSISLPEDISRWPHTEQIQFVASKVKENFAHVGGEITFLGPIRYYLFFHTWDQSPLAFTGDGELLGVDEGAAIPAVEVRMKTRLIEPQLLERMFLSAYGSILH
jgi:hypothetical protein